MLEPLPIVQRSSYVTMLKVLLLVNLIWFVSADKCNPQRRTRTPYDQVGTCERAAKVIYTRFSIDNVVNKGDYVYMYSSDFEYDIKCATTKIVNQNGKYTGYDSLYNVNGESPIITTFLMPSHSPGLILEDLQIGSGRDAIKYHFKLYVDNYNEKFGIISFTRCSDHGTRKAFDKRFVFTLKKNLGSSDAFNVATRFVIDGGKKGLLTNPSTTNTNC